VTSGQPLRVLHVVVAAGSGVVAVVEDHMANTSEFEHHALVALDETCSIGRGLEQLATSITELPPGALSRAPAIRAAVERIDPDIIHAHSSFAGAYVRTALPRRRRAHVVFTPHCYAFERTDISSGARRAYRVAESILSFRGRHVAACSPREAGFAERLPGHQHVTYVPNVVRDFVPAPRPAPTPTRTRPLLATTVGRITPAKSPEFFADAARRSRSLGLDIEWVWVGGTGGDTAGEDELRRAGVRVTGWVSRAEALRHLEATDVYVHCASWEGAPLTILEAAMADIPVIARRAPALEALGVAPLYDTVDQLLDMLREYPDGRAFEVALDSVAGLRARHTNERQREALKLVYERAAGAAAR
jgi:glycosyltransferase involved in cell wall biosynthesis